MPGNFCAIMERKCCKQVDTGRYGQTSAVAEAKSSVFEVQKTDGTFVQSAVTHAPPAPPRPRPSPSFPPSLDPPLSCDSSFVFVLWSRRHAPRLARMASLAARALCLHSCPAGGSGDKLQDFISLATACPRPLQNRCCSWFLCDVR